MRAHVIPLRGPRSSPSGARLGSATPIARRVIAVGGGKGGVGKSVVAANLAVSLARSGRVTVLLDADLGAANQHTLFGLDRLGPTLHGLFDRSIPELAAARVPTAVRNLELIPGSSALPGAANLDPDQKRALHAGILSLEADVLVIDVGAGTSRDVLDLFNLADQRLVVVLPQLTSLQNAYAFLKGAVYRVIEEAADTDARRSLFHRAAPGAETERVAALLERLGREDPDYVARAEPLLEHFGARVIGNQVVSAKDRSTLIAVSKMFQDFLGIRAPVAGQLRFNRAVGESVNRRQPLAVAEPDDDCARVLERVASELASEDVAALRSLRVPRAPPSTTEDTDPLLAEIRALLA